MHIQKKDFVELEFTGRVKDGEIFDSNILEDLKELHHGHDHPIEAKPFVFCIGESMFLNSIEEFLVGKEVGKMYEVSLEPENAFGKRNPQMIQTIPIKIFKEKNIYPQVGHSFNFDGRVGKVISVSGGRVVVDFNHFLSGKDVVYKLKVVRKIEDINEKVKALNEFFFRREIPFEIKEKNLILGIEKPLVKLAEIFSDKYKEILSLNLEINPIEPKK